MSVLATVDTILAVIIAASLLIPSAGNRRRSALSVALAFMLVVALLLSAIALDGGRP